ncbi:hypothetical protein [Mycolicibacterium sp.]|uniref:hypothetical protein n=1 Tax=Mycolicibacterium sp. TaxID=2320850 RepID=UPI0028AE0629|nr:hypothetical protein [Mycolicibacterium sp.]
MSTKPVEFVYQRRPEAELVVDTPIYLSADGDVLHLREWQYRGKVVDFALNHYVTTSHPENDGDAPLDVARIDTCHSEVHRHQFYKSGRSQNRDVIQPLYGVASLEEAEALIADCYDKCYFDLAANWGENLNRWRE